MDYFIGVTLSLWVFLLLYSILKASLIVHREWVIDSIYNTQHKEINAKNQNELQIIWTFELRDNSNLVGSLYNIHALKENQRYITSSVSDEHENTSIGLWQMWVYIAE